MREPSPVGMIDMQNHSSCASLYALTLIAAAAVMGACAAAGGPVATGRGASVMGPDSAATNLVPAGFGTLRSDEISIQLNPAGVLIRALPLDENVIRLLTTDSYQTMRSLQEGNRTTIAEVARRYGITRTSLWFVTFYGIAPQSRFSPMELLVTSLGRDHRPIEVIGLTSGFAEQELDQREKQTALYVFDADIDVNQPLVVSYLTERDESWAQILPKLESERARVRARAARSGN
jgi:hypothetical protein